MHIVKCYLVTAISFSLNCTTFCLAWKKSFHFLSSLNGKVLQLSVWEGAVPTHLYSRLSIFWALPWTKQYRKDSSNLRLHPSSFGTDGPLQTYKKLKMPFMEDFKICFNADNLDSQYHKQAFLSTFYSKFFKLMVAFQPYWKLQITYSRRSGFSPSEIILFRIAITGTPCVGGGRIIWKYWTQTGELNSTGSFRVHLHTNLCMSLVEQEHGTIISVAISMNLEARNDWDQRPF